MTKETNYVNLTSYESGSLQELRAICHKYGLNEDRIYWKNFNFVVDVFHNEIK